MIVSPLKGLSPVAIQYRITPSENRSERPSSGMPVNCSGAMKAGVPSRVPVEVTCAWVSFATPKSMIFARSGVPVSWMLAGLTSR